MRRGRRLFLLALGGAVCYNENMMNEKEYEILYKKAYRLFDGVTPLKKDCGALCGRACCRGDKTKGMLLFPHERTALRVIEANGLRCAVCGGTCARAERPLACRMFPFFPLTDRNGRVTVGIDRRAFGVCPLARQWQNVRFSKVFLRRVLAAGQLLARDPECRAFIESISAEIEELAAFYEKLNLSEPEETK